MTSPFRDLNGLTADEQAASFTDLRDLPADQVERLRDAVDHLGSVNAWLLEVTGERGHMVDEPAMTRRQMREQGLICREPHGCNGWTRAEDDELEPGDRP